jgi:4-hydroxythreonine-4-phosphate dehydrogenase
VLHTPLATRANAGSPDTANAPAIIGAIEAAVASVMRGEASAVVTNPIAKHVLKSAAFPFPGHTEFLGALAERHTGKPARPVMMLVSHDLRVVPLTVHCALADVPQAITRPLIFETVRTTYAALRRDFGISAPRIWVAGLNPHAGEEGTMGREEVDTIGPAIADLRAEGLSVSGPYSADTLFHAAARRGYDAVIAMYHDQALIPLKTIGFDEGVNVTLGLPFVRTSPDHGTAFDIAGQGRASPSSFIEALKLASAIAAARAASPST